MLCTGEMFGKRKNKEEHRYYLLPGMGRANKRKRARIFKIAIVVGIVVSVMFGILLYFLNRPGGFSRPF